MKNHLMVERKALNLVVVGSRVLGFRVGLGFRVLGFRVRQHRLSSRAIPQRTQELVEQKTYIVERLLTPDLEKHRV